MGETMAKSHRKTAQFWINYAYLLDMYLILDCAMKTDDKQLFAYVLYQICALSVFLSTNH